MYYCTPHFSKSRKADYAATLNVKFPKSTGSSQLHPATDSDRHRLQAPGCPPKASTPTRPAHSGRTGSAAAEDVQSAGPHAPPPRRKHPLTRLGTRGTQELGPGTGRPKGAKQKRQRRRLRARREGGPHIPEGGAVSQVTRRPEPQSNLSQITTHARTRPRRERRPEPLAPLLLPPSIGPPSSSQGRPGAAAAPLPRRSLSSPQGCGFIQAP